MRDQPADNPYAAPRASAEKLAPPLPQTVAGKRRSILAWLVMPAVVGGLIGSQLSPTDWESSQFFGWGGLLGLAVSFLVRWARHVRPNK